MRLKNSIFLWVFLAALIPLAILGLIATSWSEQRYLERVDQDLTANLSNIATRLGRRLLVERDIATGLASVPVVTRFKDVLHKLKHGEVHPQAERLRAELQTYIETFQTVRVSLDTVRILDHTGRTLIKVRAGQHAEPVFDGFGELPYVEPEPDDVHFTEDLDGLRPEGVGSLLLARSVDLSDSGFGMPVYSTVMPLRDADGIIGYLTIDPPIGPLNRTLDVSMRLHEGSLLIAEFDQERPDRDGRIVYDEELGVDLWSVLGSTFHLAEEYPAIYAAAQDRAGGSVDVASSGMRTYFEEFLPYPDSLVTWVLALRIDSDALTAPFQRLRIGIIASIATMLLLSLLLARGAARQIATPVVRLVDGMTAFARGQRGHRVAVEGPDEIKLAGMAFNDMADSLQATEKQRDEAMAAQYRGQRLASLGQMAGGVAHEISNPVNTILSLTTLIERQLPEDAQEIRDDVASIREECERAASTIHAMMNFSPDIQGETTQFEAEEWVRGTLALAGRESRVSGIQVDVEIISSCTVEGDLNLLQRLLRNLIENASQASPSKGRVTVRLTAEDSTCVVEVLDDGPGLDDEQADRAFDPFFTTKAEGEGSGLGLSISQGIVQYHGGELTLQNRPEGGAVARILLPRPTPATAAPPSQAGQAEDS